MEMHEWESEHSLLKMKDFLT